MNMLSFTKGHDSTPDLPNQQHSLEGIEPRSELRRADLWKVRQHEGQENKNIVPYLRPRRMKVKPLRRTTFERGKVALGN